MPLTNSSTHPKRASDNKKIGESSLRRRRSWFTLGDRRSINHRCFSAGVILNSRHVPSRTCIAASPPPAAAAAAAAAAVGDCWRVGHAPACLGSKVACALPSTPRAGSAFRKQPMIRRAFANTAFVHSWLSLSFPDRFYTSFSDVDYNATALNCLIKTSSILAIALFLLSGTVLSIYFLAISQC